MQLGFLDQTKCIKSILEGEQDGHQVMGVFKVIFTLFGFGRSLDRLPVPGSVLSVVDMPIECINSNMNRNSSSSNNINEF